MEADEARAGVMEEMQVQLQPKDGDDDPIFAALMLACREARWRPRAPAGAD